MVSIMHIKNAKNKFLKEGFKLNSTVFDIIDNTPFENAQRGMGKNTFPILLLNDDNMIGEH